ncbi:DUF234 domain-containing protein [Streptomyces sp. NPDC001276]|uniref:DUF234 domain-containing protein n=1 Tax=Streptomyces sp. NPDC001276 TaxID=3364555 RepID=UPI00369EDB58
MTETARTDGPASEADNPTTTDAVTRAPAPPSTDGSSVTRRTRYREVLGEPRFRLIFVSHTFAAIAETLRITTFSGVGHVLALERIERSWTAWRGSAVEPVIRESLLRLLPDERWPETEMVGGWWNRQNNPEIDLVGTDLPQALNSVRAGETPTPVAGAVHFVGSIKWLESQPFGRREYDALARDVLAVPGAGPGTPLVAVSRGGVAGSLPLAAHWGPEDLVRAWQ